MTETPSLNTRLPAPSIYSVVKLPPATHISAASSMAYMLPELSCPSSTKTAGTSSLFDFTLMPEATRTSAPETITDGSGRLPAPASIPLQSLKSSMPSPVIITVSNPPKQGISPPPPAVQSPFISSSSIPPSPVNTLGMLQLSAVILNAL